MATNPVALVQRPPQGITVARDADVYRLGALVLVWLDRAGLITRVTRLVLYRQRVLTLHLPLSYDLVAASGLEHHLTQRTGLTARLVTAALGCVLIIDLKGV